MKRAARRLRAAAALLTLAGTVVACTPELNWREVHAVQGGLKGLLPCRPKEAERPLLLAGARVDYHLQSCSAADVTWAIASADVRDPASVGPALVDLGRSMQANVAAASVESRPVAVPGMTPHAESARWLLVGRQSEGSAVHVQLAAFARGTVVFEALAFGPQLDADAIETFLGSLRFE